MRKTTIQKRDFKKGTLVFVEFEGEIGEVACVTRRGGIWLIAYAPKGDRMVFISPKESWHVDEVREGSDGSLVSDYTDSGEKYGGLGVIQRIFRKSRKALVRFPNGNFRVKLENLSQKIPF